MSFLYAYNQINLEQFDFLENVELPILQNNIKSSLDIFNINPSHFFSTFSKIKSTSITGDVPNTLFIFPVIIFNKNFTINSSGDLDDKGELGYQDGELNDHGKRFIFKKFFSPLPKSLDVEELTQLRATKVTNSSTVYPSDRTSQDSIRIMKLDENNMIAFFNGVVGSRSENMNFVKNGLIFLKKYWDQIKNQTIKTGVISSETFENYLKNNSKTSDSKSSEIRNKILYNFGIGLNSVNFIHVSTDFSRACNGFIICRDLITDSNLNNSIKILLSFDKNFKTTDDKKKNILKLIESMPYINIFNVFTENINKLNKNKDNKDIIKLYKDTYFNPNPGEYTINPNKDLFLDLIDVDYEKNNKTKNKLIYNKFKDFKLALKDKNYKTLYSIKYIPNLNKTILPIYDKNIEELSTEQVIFIKDQENYLLYDSYDVIKLNNIEYSYFNDNITNKVNNSPFDNIIFNNNVFNYDNILSDFEKNDENLENISKIIFNDQIPSDFNKKQQRALITNIRYKASALSKDIYNRFNDKLVKLKNDIKNDENNLSNIKNIINSSELKYIFTSNESYFKLITVINNYNNFFKYFDDINSKQINIGLPSIIDKLIQDIYHYNNKYTNNNFQSIIPNYNYASIEDYIIFVHFLNIINKSGIDISSIQYNNKFLDNNIKNLNLNLNIPDKIEYNYFITMLDNYLLFMIQTIFINKYLEKYIKNPGNVYNFYKNIYNSKRIKYTSNDDWINCNKMLKPNSINYGIVLTTVYSQLFNPNYLNDKILDTKIPKVLDINAGLSILNNFVESKQKTGIYARGYKLPLYKNIQNTEGINISCLKSTKTQNNLISSVSMDIRGALNINKDTFFETDDIRRNYVFFQTYGVNLLSRVTSSYSDSNTNNIQQVNTNIIPSNFDDKINFLINKIIQLTTIVKNARYQKELNYANKFKAQIIRIPEQPPETNTISNQSQLSISTVSNEKNETLPPPTQPQQNTQPKIFNQNNTQPPPSAQISKSNNQPITQPQTSTVSNSSQQSLTINPPPPPPQLSTVSNPPPPPPTTLPKTNTNKISNQSQKTSNEQPTPPSSNQQSQASSGQKTKNSNVMTFKQKVEFFEKKTQSGGKTVNNIMKQLRRLYSIDSKEAKRKIKLYMKEVKKLLK
jgi:hypothetical protein